MNVGKILILLGFALIVIGALFWMVGKVHLPGNFKFSGEKYTLYFPLATSIVVSILLTLLINVALYFYRK